MKKIERIQGILEILNRWGKQSKSEIDQKLAGKFGKSIDAGFERATYRDLNTLVDQCRAVVEYYTRDGALIDDYDPSIYKNVQCKWSAFNTESNITGGSILRNINSKIYCPKILQDDIMIVEGDKTIEFDTKYFYFSISGMFLALKVNLKALPIKFIISRVNGDILPNEILAIEKEYNKRTVLFKVPASKVSSFDISKKRYGHLQISLEPTGIEVQDLSSTNGTNMATFSREVSDEIRKNKNLFSKNTADLNWDEVVNGYSFDFKELKGKAKLESDFLLNLADDFCILFV